jgi:integrase/recombinase XerD
MRWRPSNALWDLIPGWREQRILRGLNPVTIAKQLRHLEGFAFFAQERGVLRVDQVDPRLVRLYAAHLDRPPAADRPPATAGARPLSRGAQHNRLRALRSFCRWCVALNVIADDPTAGVPFPQPPRSRARRALSHGQVAAVLALPDIETPSGLRDRALLEVAYSTGLRASELAALTWDAIQDAAGVIAVRRGKGGRDRVVPIGARALRWVAAYRREAWPTLTGRAHAPTTALWLGLRGAPLSGKRVSDIAADYLRAAGVPAGRGAAHLLRHSMATHLSEDGAAVDAIAAMLGHEGGRTTATYTHVSVSSLAGHLARVRGEA